MSVQNERVPTSDLISDAWSNEPRLEGYYVRSLPEFFVNDPYYQSRYEKKRDQERTKELPKLQKLSQARVQQWVDQSAQQPTKQPPKKSVLQRISSLFIKSF